MVTTILLYLLLTTFSFLGFYLYGFYWSKPEKILEKLIHQGIKGPPRSFLGGNVIEMKRIAALSSQNKPKGDQRRSLTENYASTLFPYFDKWRKDYGPVFIFSTLNIPALYVSDPDLVKHISLCVSLDLGKATYLQKSQEPLFGNGILKANGLEWAHQRKIISPQFFMGKVKGMVELMVDAAIPLLRKWESKIDDGGGSADIVVDEDLMNFSADVISRACFGSSYSRGKDIFHTLRALQKAISNNPSFLFKLPYQRCLQFQHGRDVKKLVGEVQSMIMKVVKERREKWMEKDNDLLQSIVESAETDGFIVDNCKNIYFAGHDTTTVSATWCLMLLAAHPEWQDRARREVLHFCHDGVPHADLLPKLKNLTMVIQETLRLYPPSAFVSRETFREMRFGKLVVPKGTNMWIPIATMHHDCAIWGENAGEFHPERFVDGVQGACSHPEAYIPFGLGARKCVGQNLALAELKVVLALLLSRLRFELSPRYRHSPAFSLTIGPEFGLSLVIRKLCPS